MSAIWIRNLARITRRWPLLAARLAATEVQHAEVRDGALRYRGAQVTTVYDRAAEASAQATAAPTFCAGVGLGDLPRLLAGRAPITIALPSLEIARVSFEHERAEWLETPGLELTAADSVKWTGGPFAAVAMECWLADEQGYELRDRVFIEVHKEIQRIRQARESQRVTEQFRANASRFQYPVEALYGTAPGSSAVVIGGGPSLTGELAWLKSCGKRPVIACQAALGPLLSVDVVPDQVVVMESDTAAVRYFDGLDMSRFTRTALCYNPDADPKLIEMWPGPRCHVSGLFLGGTVLHTCVDLATRMGAAEVTLLGFDCCRPGGQSYAAGVVATGDVYTDTPLRMWTIDGNGRPVMTLPSMTQWHRHMEDLIAARPVVKFYKRGRAGVPLKGATWSE